MAIHHHSYEGAYHAQLELGHGNADVIIHDSISTRSISLPLSILLILVGDLLVDAALDSEAMPKPASGDQRAEG